MANLVDLDGEWAAAIGRAFIAFGSIEQVTVNCVREIPRDRIQRSTSKLNLIPRIDLILELLEAYDGEPFSLLAAKLSLAKQMVKTRNLIAHNPLVLDVYENSAGDFLFQAPVVRSLRNEQHHITLSELQQFAADADTLASELYRQSSRVFQALRSATIPKEVVPPNAAPR